MGTGGVLNWLSRARLSEPVLPPAGLFQQTCAAQDGTSAAVAELAQVMGCETRAAREEDFPAQMLSSFCVCPV